MDNFKKPNGYKNLNKSSYISSKKTNTSWLSYFFK